MKQEIITKQLMRSIDIAKESFKSNMEISIDTYAEVISQLNLMAYVILNEEKNKA